MVSKSVFEINLSVYLSSPFEINTQIYFKRTAFTKRKPHNSVQTLKLKFVQTNNLFRYQTVTI